MCFIYFRLFNVTLDGYTTLFNVTLDGYSTLVISLIYSIWTSAWLLVGLDKRL